MDLHPQIVAGHMALGEAVSRLDQLETRTWNARCRGLYLAPEIPADRAESISGNVVLHLAYLSLEGRP